MKVNKNDDLQTQNTHIINSSSKSRREGLVSGKSRTNEKQEKRGSVFAGNLNLSQQDSIASKHVQNQKKALKSILDQYKKDAKNDNNIVSRREQLIALEEEANLAKTELDKVSVLRQQLKDSYDITENSEEEKDLKLLQKSMDPDATLSEDELERLSGMGPLTEYQKSALEYDTMEETWQERYDNAKKGKVFEGQSIVAIKLALLKSHPMTDAQKEAAKIMEAANQEVVNTILQQAKDNIDDDIEKKKEEAEKEAKEQEEKEASSEDKELEKVNKRIELIQEADKDQEKLQTDLKNIIDKMKIMDEDVKGILVDEQK